MTDHYNPRCILVLGMHRSGTSALTGVLSYLGVETGPYLLPAHEKVNPKGFWEHAEIVSIHDRLLESMGYSWDDIRELPVNWWKSAPVSVFRKEIVQVVQRDFSSSSLWVVKDPRMSRLLPLWLDVLAEIKVEPLIILPLREPYNVAKSLEKRDGFSEIKAYLLWMQHFLDAELWSRGYPRIAVTYQQLMNDWMKVVDSLAEQFSISLDTGSPSAVEKVENFLEPSLQHHSVQEHFFAEDELSQLANETYRLATIDLSAHGDFFSYARQRTNLIASWIGPWAASMKEMEWELVHLSQENVHLKKEVARIKATLSWQLTKPLRFIANLPALIKRAGGFFS